MIEHRGLRSVVMWGLVTLSLLSVGPGHAQTLFCCYRPTPAYAWGDSLTAGNQDGSGVSYPSALAATSPKRSVVNEGVGGDTSSQILTRFQALPSSWSGSTFIWSGNNNVGSPATVESDIATMVASLTTYQYMVLSLIVAEGEYNTGNYFNLLAINSALAATYGNRYVDVQSQLVAAYNPANPVDVIDFSMNTVPFTLRAITFTGTIVGAINNSSCSFTLAGTGVSNVGPSFIITVGSEYIYLNSVSGGVVTACTRGYAGTTAASYGPGQSAIATDYRHLSAAGYTLVASYAFSKMQFLGGW